MLDQASRSSASGKNRRTFGLLALLSILAVAAPPAAWAGKRVVLTKFTGPQAKKAQKAVAKVIKSEHTVVPTKRLNKAKKKLKIKKLNASNVQKLAEELAVDAIVSGQMKRKGSRWQLVITVREGKTGDVIDSYTVKLRGPKIDDKARNDIAENVLPSVAAAEPISGGGGGEVASAGKTGGRGKAGRKATPEEEEAASTDDESGGGDEDGAGEANSGGGDDETPPPKNGKKPGKVAMNEPPSSSETPAAGDGDEPAASTEKGAEPGGDADGEDSVEVGDHYARDAAADVSAGFSFIGRNMAFTYDSSVTTQPWGYRGNPVPGVNIVGEVYPMAFGGSKGFIANLGLGLTFDRVITLRSRLMSGGDEYDTAQTRWGVDARYRWNIGSTPTSPSVRFMVGYNGLSFIIDTKGTPIDLPNVSYHFVDLGAGGRLPLGSPRMAINLDAKYLQVLGTGAMQEMGNYGGASVTGVDLDLNFEFRPLTRLVVRVGGRYTRIGYAFDGSGTKTTDRDSDPDVDVGGALDQYFGGYLLGGYLF